ncbi:MAG: helix-turn-helix transcriptional regulator [Methanophagales archaeon]|nr:helix-turn-helix transcriptional regulator [Methanophagales archaeon]
MDRFEEEHIGAGNRTGYIHPEAEALILVSTYEAPVRSKRLIEKVQALEDLSEPTIYNILRNLDERGLIRRIEKSRRNVQYELTEKGRKMVEEEQLKARETLLAAVRSIQDPEEIVFDLILDDVLKDLPEEWRAPEKKKKLRTILEEEIETAKKRLIRMSTILWEEKK